MINKAYKQLQGPRNNLIFFNKIVGSREKEKKEGKTYGFRLECLDLEYLVINVYLLKYSIWSHKVCKMVCDMDIENCKCWQFCKSTVSLQKHKATYLHDYGKYVSILYPYVKMGKFGSPSTAGFSMINAICAMGQSCTEQRGYWTGGIRPLAQNISPKM